MRSESVEQSLESYQMFMLTGGPHSTNDFTVITVTLAFDDLNNIKSLRNLASGDNSTFVFITSSLVRDMNMNLVTAISVSNAISVTNFTNDETPPELTSFDVDLSTDTILLTFSETIKPESLNFTLISFTNNDTNDTVVYTLTGGNRTDADSRFLNITLNKQDSDEIRFLTELLTSTADTYITLGVETITDMNDNPVNMTVRRVANFYADLVRPGLVSYDLDLNEGLLLLTFSETVNATSLSTTGITFQDSMNTAFGTTLHTLTGGYSVYGDNTTITIKLSDSDLNELKRLEPLVTSQNTTYLSLSETVIQDMNRNILTAVPSNTARMVIELIPDTTDPMIRSYTLDLNSGEITISFSETVDADTLKASEFTIHSSLNDSSPSYTFFQVSSTSYTNSSDGTSIVLQLSTDDLNAVKEDPLLATSQANTYLSFTSDAIADMFNNNLVERNDSDALNASLFIPDQTSPRLTDFSLNMSAIASEVNER